MGDWAGVAPGGSFKTVDRVSVCDWMGHISITETQLIKRALRDARILSCLASRFHLQTRRLERECCLLVLNLVSSTLSCIRQPRPRLVCVCVCVFAH